MITVKRLREMLAGVNDDARVTIEDGDYGFDACLLVRTNEGAGEVRIEVGRFNAPDYSQSTSLPETAAAKTTEATGPE